MEDIRTKWGLFGMMEVDPMRRVKMNTRTNKRLLFRWMVSDSWLLEPYIRQFLLVRKCPLVVGLRVSTDWNRNRWPGLWIDIVESRYAITLTVLFLSINKLAGLRSLWMILLIPWSQFIPNAYWWLILTHTASFASFIRSSRVNFVSEWSSFSRSVSISSVIIITFLSVVQAPKNKTTFGWKIFLTHEHNNRFSTSWFVLRVGNLSVLLL